MLASAWFRPAGPSTHRKHSKNAYNARWKQRFIVIEADEYYNMFLGLLPQWQCSPSLNTTTDCFPTMGLPQAFKRLSAIKPAGCW